MLLKKNNPKKKYKKADFLKFSPYQKKKELNRLSEDLKGKRIVHINATANGGGVAEILNSLIPYSQAMGIKASWYVIDPKIGGNFFKTTNKFFDGCQGKKVNISKADWREYEKKSQIIAEEIDKLKADILVINDTQPLLAGFLASSSNKVFYSHVDSSFPDQNLWKKFLPFFENYKKIVFSHKEYVNKQKSLQEKTVIFPPAIDPLALKQKRVAKKTARHYLKEKGKISLSGPLIVQVSRFDAWKNPIGLIKAFFKLPRQHKNAQLALVGFNVAKDNPAAELAYKKTKLAAKGNENIRLFYYPKNNKVTEFTMMAQNGADIVVQNSYREGFGLTVSEAMWKKKAVIGGPASGIKKQINHNKNGLIANNPAELAEQIEKLLNNPGLRKKLGQQARQTVKDKFLFNRLLLDHLKLYYSCLR